jgi:hypothetical protein
VAPALCRAKRRFVLAGFLDRPVLAILIVSTIVVIIGFFAAYYFF